MMSPEATPMTNKLLCRPLHTKTYPSQHQVTAKLSACTKPTHPKQPFSSSMCVYRGGGASCHDS